MVKVLRRLMHEPMQEVPLELRIMVDGNVLVLPAATLARIRSHVLAHHKLNSGREAAEKELPPHSGGSGIPTPRTAPIMIMDARSSRTGLRARLVQDVLQRVVAGSQRRQRSPG